MASSFACANMVNGSILVGENFATQSEGLKKIEKVDCGFDFNQIVSKLNNQSTILDSHSQDNISYTIKDFNYDISKKGENNYNHNMIITAEVEFEDFMGRKISKTKTFEFEKDTDSDHTDSYMIRQGVFQAFAFELSQVKEALTYN